MFLIWCLLGFVSQRVTGHGWLPTRAVGVDFGHNIIWPLQSDHVLSPDAFCFNVDMTLFQKSSEDVKTSFIPSFLGISGLNHVKTIENPSVSAINLPGRAPKPCRPPSCRCPPPRPERSRWRRPRLRRCKPWRPGRCRRWRRRESRGSLARWKSGGTPPVWWYGKHG